MTKTIQHLRGTTAQNEAFTGASGEITVDTQTHELRVHDGSTAGGHVIYTKNEIDTAMSNKADDNNVVHLSDSETITGLKTVLRNDSRVMYAKSSVIDKTVTPGSNQHLFTDFIDKNGVRLGVMGAVKDTSGRYGVYMQCGNVAGINLTVQDDDTGVQFNMPEVSYLSSVPTTVTNATTHRQVPSMGWVNDATKATNVVHRDSTETITGGKTFSSTINTTFSTQYPNGLVHKNTLIPNNYSSPSNDVNMVVNGLLSNAGDFIAYEQMGKTAAGVTSAALNVRNRANASGSNRNYAIGVSIDSNGNTWGHCPASDVNGSIVTTVNKSKSNSKGYVKLGNGLIIQWGSYNADTASQTISFATAFSSASSYSIAFAYTSTVDITANVKDMCIASRTSSSFTTTNATRNATRVYIAIGY